jgi:hypothetical protein
VVSIFIVINLSLRTHIYDVTDVVAYISNTITGYLALVHMRYIRVLGTITCEIC